MSEQRIPDAIWKFNSALPQGKKVLRIELFMAKQWQHSWKPYKKSVNPHPPLRDSAFWNEHYRLRVDGKWYGINGYKFNFFTMVESVELAQRLLQNGNGA
jgi:hypothetical protein